jgi:hypothetical protein
MILVSDWEIFGIVALTSGLAIALGIFITLYAKLLGKQNCKADRDSHQTDEINRIS